MKTPNFWSPLVDRLHRWSQGVKRWFLIYTQEEADALGLKYVHWRKAKEGDWALSDDGYVGECIKIYGPYWQRGKSNVYMIFSYGCVWPNKKVRLNYLERKATRSFCSASSIDWATRETRSRRGKRLIDTFCRMYMHGGKIDLEILGRVYRPDQKDYTRVAKYILRQEIFKKMIEEKLVELLAEKGITKGSTLDKYEEIYEMAKAGKKTGDMIKVVDTHRDMLEMMPKALPPGGRLPPGEEVDYEVIETQIEEAKKLAGRKKELPEAEAE